MIDRYTIEESTLGSWSVIDTEADKWRLNKRAVSLYVRKEAALALAAILNVEWHMFQRKPS